MVNYHLVSVRPVLRAVRLEQILVGVEEHAPAAVHAGDPHRQVGRLVARPHAQLDRLLGRPLPDHQPDVTPSPESGKGVSMFREMLFSSWCVDPPVHQPNLGPAVVGDRPFSVKLSSRWRLSANRDFTIVKVGSGLAGQHEVHQAHAQLQPWGDEEMIQAL